MVGIKNITTGDTLCDEEYPILLEPLSFPDPVISMAVEPKTKLDQEKMSNALQRLAEEDPTFRVFTNEETGQTIIAGMGELHLEIIRDRMFREFKVGANAGKPQIAYKETILVPADGEGKLVKQSGGRGQYGHVIIKIAPNARGKGITIENKVVGGNIPKDYIPAYIKGLDEATQNSVVAGYPVMQARISGMETKGSLCTINAEVPLAEMFGYATAIRSLSKGRSSYSMEPSHFEQVPANVLNAVLDQQKG
jgi:elongation factor G